MQNVIGQENVNEAMYLSKNESLTMGKFVPLEDRINLYKPELKASLAKLKTLIGQEKFDKYINSAQNLNVSGSKLLLISGSERMKTLMEREIIPALKQAFGVDYVRIIGGAGMAGVDAF